MPEGMADGSEGENFEQFRDIFSNKLIERLTKPPKRAAKARKKARLSGSSTNATTPKRSTGETPSQEGLDVTQDAEELSDFSDYLSRLTFDSLPPELRAVTPRTWGAEGGSPPLRERYPLPLTSSDVADLIQPSLDPDITDSLTAYHILQPPEAGEEDVATFLAPVLTTYLTTVAIPTPTTPNTTNSRAVAEECEICGRDWVPLTYHHLIPRFVHDKAVRRGWHRREDLQRVAWLCRACHSFVHRLAGHEELAREYDTVERLLAREEVRSFAAWVGRVRWKAR